MTRIILTMDVHRRRCRQNLGLDKKLPPLPHMSSKYALSVAWTEQDAVVSHDLARIKGMHPRNCRRILMRYSAHQPRYGYIQGQLYLLRGLGAVCKDEKLLFWAFVQLCRYVAPYGPLGVECNMRAARIPDWVLDRMQGDVDRTVLSYFVRFRWLFILWGQSCPEPRFLWAVWDYVLQSHTHALRFASAMLEYFDEMYRDQYPYSSERIPYVFAGQLDSEEKVANILARAHMLSHK